jgi:hypothetical protein
LLAFPVHRTDEAQQIGAIPREGRNIAPLNTSYWLLAFHGKPKQPKKDIDQQHARKPQGVLFCFFHWEYSVLAVLHHEVSPLFFIAFKISKCRRMFNSIEEQ